MTDERERFAGRAVRGAPGHLRAVAYRMLGSLSEADDAVQEAWLRLSRADTSEVENLGGWLTTVVARVCLDLLRSRKARREESSASARPGRSRAARTRAIPSRRRCWPIRSVWRCSWCSTRWPPPSGSPSCCTTCSPCPSTRSPRSWGARRPRPGNWPAAPAAGCRAGRHDRRRRSRPQRTGGGRLPRRGARRRLRRAGRGARPRCRVSHRPAAGLRSTGGGPRCVGGGRSLRGACPWRATGTGQWRRGRHRGPTRPAMRRPRASRSGTARSSGSTRSPTPSACASSTCRPSTNADTHPLQPQSLTHPCVGGISWHRVAWLALVLAGFGRGSR